MFKDSGRLLTPISKRSEKVVNSEGKKKKGKQIQIEDISSFELEEERNFVQDEEDTSY